MLIWIILWKYIPIAGRIVKIPRPIILHLCTVNKRRYRMKKYRLNTGKVEDKVVNAYKKIEDGAVKGYQAVEDAVTGAYGKIEEKFVKAFLEEVPENEDTSKS